jgi:hypothetical protein
MENILALSALQPRQYATFLQAQYCIVDRNADAASEGVQLAGSAESYTRK